MSETSQVTHATGDDAAAILTGDGLVVHRRPLTVVLSAADGVDAIAPVVTEMIDELVEQNRCDFASVAGALQNLVVAHQPDGVAAVLGLPPEPIGFLFDNARIVDADATHQGEGRAGWTTVFLSGSRATATAGPLQELPAGGDSTGGFGGDSWSRVWAGAVAGRGAVVPLTAMSAPSTAADPEAEATPATEPEIDEAEVTTEPAPATTVEPEVTTEPVPTGADSADGPQADEQGDQVGGYVIG
ncbi:MAG: hypothetical protein AAF547_18815, partial [Actinomycetota bacterium]